MKVFDGTTQVGTATADIERRLELHHVGLDRCSSRLTATDTVSGVTGAASSPLSVTVDTVAPAAPVLISDSVVSTNHVLLSGTAEANSTITVLRRDDDSRHHDNRRERSLERHNRRSGKRELKR